jgi:hypothetical protein
MSGVPVPFLRETRAAVQLLCDGNARAPLARVVPDDIPALWRVVLPDGRRSDPVNVTRAKDIAWALAERGPPPRNSQRLHWKKDRSESRSGGRGRVRASAPASDAAHHFSR